jgi:hypothetical protein
VFIEHIATGRVHVAVEPDARDAWWAAAYRRRPIWRELYPQNVATLLLAAPTPCLCGLLAIRPWEGVRDGYRETFRDEALCGTCRSAWLAAGRDVAELFEHPQELDEEQ